MTRRILTLVVLFVFSTCVAHAQDAKKQAKELYSKAQHDPGILGIQEECRAADMDPGNKQYRTQCDEDTKSQLDNDKLHLEKARNASDPTTAAQQAHYVSKLNAGLYSQAQEIIAGANPKPAPVVVATNPAPPTDQSAEFLRKAQDAWTSGNFADARTNALNVKSANLKPIADGLLSSIDQYTNYMNAAKAEEGSNPRDALLKYQLASNTNPKGPGDPSAQASRMQQKVAELDAPKPVTPTPATAPTVVATNNPPPKAAAGSTRNPPPPPVDDPTHARQLVGEASSLERQGKNKEAWNIYTQAASIDGSNLEASTGVERTLKAISSDPVQIRETLVAALKDFYAGRIEDARSGLTLYLRMPKVQNAGAANFYLGATLLERSRLRDTRAAQAKGPPPEALDAFRRARQAGYKPVERLVSPALLKVWDTAGG